MKKRNIKCKAKKGPLSNEEKKNIADWLSFKADEEIARDLNRVLSQVVNYKKEYLAGAPSLTVRYSEAEEYRRELHAQSNWLQTQREFTEEELLFYENSYVEYRHQFKDMTATELKQLYQLITLEVFMHRHNSDRMKSQREVERLEKLIAKEYSVEPPQRNIDKIHLMEEQLIACRGASGGKTKEYKDLLEKHVELMKVLKGTRDQRIKNIEDRGKFISILKELELEERRRSIGEITGLMDLAVTVERERLSKPHQYADKMIDQPILNANTYIETEE